MIQKSICFFAVNLLICFYKCSPKMELLKYNERIIQVITLGFANLLMPLEWNRDMGLGQYLTAAKMLGYGKTDCALPMSWAIEQGIYVDVFIVLTDSDISIKSVSSFSSFVKLH